jgi:hypothetical protein
MSSSSSPFLSSLGISGAACVVALRALGFRVVERREGGVVLRGPSGRIAFVPANMICSEVVLDRLMESANPLAQFVEAVANAPTLPDLEDEEPTS